MSEIQAWALNAVVGSLATWGCVLLLSALGAGDGPQICAALLGLVGTSLMVGVIGRHYERKEIERGEDPERR